MNRICYRLLIPGLFLLFLLGLYEASAATNTVSRSSLDDVTLSVTAEDLKPAECAAQHVSNIIVGSGVISGTGSSNLILGGPGADTISGAGGNDCIVGGGGIDTLIGDAGNDTCVGGPGTDILDLTCERAEQ